MCVPINISGERWLLDQRPFNFNQALFSAIFYSQLLLHDLQPDKLGRWISRLGHRSFHSWDTCEKTKRQITVSKKWKGVHFQGTYSVSWSYQGPPGCVWLYRGGERVTEAYVANIMVPFFPIWDFAKTMQYNDCLFQLLHLDPGDTVELQSDDGSSSCSTLLLCVALSQFEQ